MSTLCSLLSFLASERPSSFPPVLSKFSTDLNPIISEFFSLLASLNSKGKGKSTAIDTSKLTEIEQTANLLIAWISYRGSPLFGFWDKVNQAYTALSWSNESTFQCKSALIQLMAIWIQETYLSQLDSDGVLDEFCDLITADLLDLEIETWAPWVFLMMI